MRTHNPALGCSQIVRFVEAGIGDANLAKVVEKGALIDQLKLAISKAIALCKTYRAFARPCRVTGDIGVLCVELPGISIQ